MLESARRQGIEVEVIGAGMLYENFWLSKCVRLWEAIGRYDQYEHVVFVDGIDTFFVAPLDELHDGFRRYRHDFVIAGEHICWPCSHLTDHPRFAEGGRYRFPCAGFWMATWPAFLRTFAALLAMPHTDRPLDDGQTIYNCDQARYQLGMAEGTLAIGIDTEQRLSQCLHRLDDRWTPENPDIDWTNPQRPRNRATGQQPCTIHLNGPDKRQLARLREVLFC